MVEEQDEPPPDNVVSLTDVLRRVHRPKECHHKSLLVDEKNRVIECEDCHKSVDPFEAMCLLADRTGEWQRRYDAMRKDHKNLADYVPHLRAVRTLEGMWRGKRLPMCPHCKKGVTAEGLNKMGWVHQAYAEAVEKDAKERGGGGDIVPLPQDGGAPDA